MPRDGSGVYSPPNGTVPVTTATVIASAPYNSLIADLVQDANTPRPVVMGGTGAATAEQALINLGAISSDNFLDGLSIGDFWNTAIDLTSDERFLRRDGDIYDQTDYPTLAALFDPLPAGLAWTPLTAPFGSATPGGMATGDDRTVILSGATVYWSDDALTWNTVSLPFSATTIAYGGGRFVVIGSLQSAASTDGGETWTASATVLQSIVTSPLKFGGGVFAIADIGSPGSNSARIATSIDGLVWTSQLGPPADSRTYIVLIGDEDGFVAKDSLGFFYTSTDGDSWTMLTPDISTGTSLSGARASESSAIVVGATGGVYSTPDFVDMTLRSSGTTQNLNFAYYFAPYYFVVANGGIARISSDGGANFLSSSSGTTNNLLAISASPDDAEEVLVAGQGFLARVAQTSSDQFRVPDDDPEYGWIKALDEAP